MTRAPEGAEALRRELAIAVDQLDVPVQRLTETSRARGRVVRRRRRAGAAALAAVTVVTALGAGALTGVGAPGGRAVDPAAGPTPPTPAARAGSAGATWPNTLGPVDVPARRVLQTLRPLLPAGTTVTAAQLTVTDPAPGDSDALVGRVRVDLDRGDAGRGGLEVVIYSDPGSDPAGRRTLAALSGTSCPATGYDPPPQTCRELQTDGQRTGRELETTADGLTIREVLAATTGAWVYVGEANSLDDKWGAGHAALPGPPPLTLDELRDLATASAWADLVAAG